MYSILYCLLPQMLHIKQTTEAFVCHLHNVLLHPVIPLLNCPTSNKAVPGICWFLLYTVGPARCLLCLPAFIIPLIEICCLHTSRRAPGHPFCFMTISVVLPWHQALWPRSLILSSLLKFQPLAGSFLYHSRTPKCCHSLLPGHLVLRVRGMNCDL